MSLQIAVGRSCLQSFVVRRLNEEVVRTGKGMVATQVRALVCVPHQYGESLGSKELKFVKHLTFEQKEIIDSIYALSRSHCKIP